ncbi:MAG: VIT1/CCC1 transporter family protein [Anaerolineae bacterium]|nr:VIT1/CCC1 transporter family protein [Anaerolineae bacterium]
MVPRLAMLSKLEEYRRISKIDEIGRRYFAMNAFDGILTMIGVLMGGFIGGIKDSRIVLYTGMATCVAMGVSGFWGAYVTEAAERKHDMHELEQAMLRDMSKTTQARAARFAVIVVSLIDGLSPLVAGILVVLPFFFTHLWGDITISYIASLAIALVMLFVLGAFLAKVAKENVFRSGIRMLIAGLVSVALSFLLNLRK